MSEEKKTMKELIEGTFYVVESSVLFSDKQSAEWFKNYLTNMEPDEQGSVKTLSAGTKEVALHISDKPKKKKGSK